MELSEHLRQKVAAYKVPAAVLASIKGTPLVFLVGIAGAGKNTVLQRLLQLHPNRYHVIVSHTTRAPRENNGVMEHDGVEYHFIDLPTAEHMLDEGAYIEAKVIHNRAISGTSVAEVAEAKKEGKIAINDINIEGVAEYIEHGLHPRAIFLLPPNYEVWRARLQSRYDGAIPKEDLIQRLRSALSEIDHALSVDYYYIVINSDLDKTAELVHQIAEGQAVEPHYHKAIQIAEDLRANVKHELDNLV